MNYVQAHISNISFPDSLEEVEQYASCFNMEMILIGDKEEPEHRMTEWTVPKWSKPGDIVFFMHAATADSKISRLRSRLLAKRASTPNDDFWILMNALTRARKLYDTYGGTIFAIGRISDNPGYNSDDHPGLHWKSRIYAPVNDIFLLEHPVSIAEFRSEVMVARQSAITPVFGTRFDFLKALILKKNKVVEDYFVDAVAEPMPLYGLDDSNWLEVTNRHRRAFFLEIQFRDFYVDRLLRALGDIKTIWRECVCEKSGSNRTFVDNVILFDKKYLPVEVKLSVSAEKDIVGQLTSYCRTDRILLTDEKCVSGNVYQDCVLVIDTERVYLYWNETRVLSPVLPLDEIRVRDDISKLRDVLLDLLHDVG